MLTKYLLGEADLNEVAAVNERLERDKAYKNRFHELKIIWEKSKNIASQATTDTDAAWQHFKSRINYQEENRRAKRKNTFAWMQVAALVIITIGISEVLIINRKMNPPKEIVLQSVQRIMHDTLPDASIITLNKYSLIAYPEKFIHNTRTVKLNGEAFFKISPNKEKPFIISVNDVRVKVLGTSFNIKAVKGNVEVVVETGIVQVMKGNHAVILHKGEKITVTRRDSNFKKEIVTDELYKYYRTNKFVCHATPLWKLIATLNEAYGTNITIQNNTIRNLPITTTFPDNSLNQILDVIFKTLKVTGVKKNDQIIIQ